MCLIISRSILPAATCYKMGEYKLPDHVPENKIRVRMSLMPEKA
jgi:hypothetical protein